MKKKLFKEGLIELVNKRSDPKSSDEEISKNIDILEDNVPHPAPSDLIFWNDEDLSPKEVVEIALAYQESE